VEPSESVRETVFSRTSWGFLNDFHHEVQLVDPPGVEQGIRSPVETFIVQGNRDDHFQRLRTLPFWEGLGHQPDLVALDESDR